MIPLLERLDHRAGGQGIRGGDPPVPVGDERLGRAGRAAAIVGLACLLVAGCGDSKSKGPQRLSPRSVPYLEGVAVPAGFKLVDDMVMDSESGGQRMARHTYVGGADPHAVRNFYREQMPLLGWDRVTDQNFKGVITIRFEKNHEACTVEIRPSGGVLDRTAIHVLVQPFNRTPLQPPKKPTP
jgi:hypothetical protein